MQQTQVTQLRNAVDRIGPSIDAEESFVHFPLNKIIGEEAKLISKVNGTFSQTWKTKFSWGLDSYFVTSHLAKIASVWNTCSDSTKTRILYMSIGERAKKDELSSQIC